MWKYTLFLSALPTTIAHKVFETNSIKHCYVKKSIFQEIEENTFHGIN